MKTIYKISAYVLVLLGIGHTALTPAFYSSFSEDFLWFAGTGLGLLFLGLLNLVVIETPQAKNQTMSIVANLLGTLFGIAVIFAVTQPQALIALLAFVFVAISSIYFRFRGEEVSPL